MAHGKAVTLYGNLSKLVLGSTTKLAVLSLDIRWNGSYVNTIKRHNFQQVIDDEKALYDWLSGLYGQLGARAV